MIKKYIQPILLVIFFIGDIIGAVKTEPEKIQAIGHFITSFSFLFNPAFLLSHAWLLIPLIPVWMGLSYLNAWHIRRDQIICKLVSLYNCQKQGPNIGGFELGLKEADFLSLPIKGDSFWNIYFLGGLRYRNMILLLSELSIEVEADPTEGLGFTIKTNKDNKAFRSLRILPVFKYKQNVYRIKNSAIKSLLDIFILLRVWNRTDAAIIPCGKEIGDSKRTGLYKDRNRAIEGALLLRKCIYDNSNSCQPKRNGFNIIVKTISGKTIYSEPAKIF